MNTYAWRIDVQVDSALQVGDVILRDVIVRLNWQLIASDGTYTDGSQTGTLRLAKPNPEDFIPGHDILPAQLLEWFNSAINPAAKALAIKKADKALEAKRS